MSSPNLSIPVFLLKTKSTPNDSYEEHFSSSTDGKTYAPQFVPVLLHKFNETGLNKVRLLLDERKVSRDGSAPYGGLIFTSQRAVEGFAKIVKEGQEKGAHAWPHLQEVPIYSVGPATTKALSAISQEPPLQIFGSHTGNGEALAQFIQSHYASWYSDRLVKPPLLFLVGEQRRDIIPSTLMGKSLTHDQYIQVDEEVVYGTGVMDSFAEDFRKLLQETDDFLERWIVVFSPTGCDSMLRELGILDEKSQIGTAEMIDHKTFIATIGPTTKSYLIRNFGFEPHVCAETPSPEGVLGGIHAFRNRRE